MKQGNKKATHIVLELTEAEQKALNTVLLGHGNGKKAANKTRIHRLTLRRISFTGKGYKRNIEIIRSKLLEPIGVYQKIEENGSVDSKDTRVRADNISNKQITA